MEDKQNFESIGLSKPQIHRTLPLFNIDLNVAPPEDAASDGANSQQIPPAAAPDALLSKGEEEQSMNTVADSEVKTEEEKDKKFRLWNALLQVAENALHEHQQKGKEIQNLKRKTSQESELGAEVTRAEAVAVPVVVRSTRGRAVAMPNKYRDSVLDTVELPRHNKSGNKRKFR